MINRHKHTIILSLAAVLLIILGSCDQTKKLEKEESEKIQEYLNSNSNLNFVLKPSGLYYLETLAGSGSLPVTRDTAYVFYTGRFLDGTIFDSNEGTTDTLIFPLNEGWVITGFNEGITYMKLGGKSQLIVPSSLGYGAEGRSPLIDGYTPLLFDIELVLLKEGPGE